MDDTEDLAIEEVVAKVWENMNRDYWLHIGRVKLSVYRRSMPSLARFLPGFDWRANAARWESELDKAERGTALKMYGAIA